MISFQNTFVPVLVNIGRLAAKDSCTYVFCNWSQRKLELLADDHLGNGHDWSDHREGRQDGEQVPHDPGGTQEGIAAFSNDGQDPNGHRGNGAFKQMI